MRRNRNKTTSTPFSDPRLGSPLGGGNFASERARLPFDDLSPLVHPARAPDTRKPTRTVRSLIRTVPTDTNRPKVTNSPVVQRRASGRASVWYRQLPEPYNAPPQLPQKAIHCAKDAIRREVLFAKGSGGSKRSYPNRKSPSRTNCRR